MEFEVIEIFDDNNPYTELLGIDWATNMNVVIKLKNRKMIFEKKSLRIVVHLGPVEGVLYIKPVRGVENDDELDCIYQIMVQDQDWVNPTTDWRISWGRDSSYTSNSDEEIECWQNQLHKVITLNCNMMIK